VLFPVLAFVLFFFSVFLCTLLSAALVCSLWHCTLCCHTLGSGTTLQSQIDWFIFTTKSMRSLLCNLAVLGLLCFFSLPNFIVLIKLSHILTYLPKSFSWQYMNQWMRGQGAHLPFFYIVLKSKTEKVLIKKIKYSLYVSICMVNWFSLTTLTYSFLKRQT